MPLRGGLSLGNLPMAPEGSASRPLAKGQKGMISIRHKKFSLPPLALGLPTSWVPLVSGFANAGSLF